MVYICKECGGGYSHRDDCAFGQACKQIDDLEMRLAAAMEVIEAVKNIRYSEETDEFNEHDLSQLMVAYAVYSKKFESANG